MQHQVVAMNGWRGKVNNTIDQSCQVLLMDTRESLLYRFWECRSTIKAQRWRVHILHLLASNQEQTTRPQMRGNDGTITRSPIVIVLQSIGIASTTTNIYVTFSQFTPSWKHSLLAYRIPMHFKIVSWIQLLPWGSCHLVNLNRGE